ncbi:peptide ABC transporter substrate-binding protein [Secundilactobacillus paracollinoides]|uniref:Peptide ABC transporter substrate-binding protein n=1 Tax=Secundilactobacillus paracollinoides TaxID=240427 RepID=A0A1B2IXZ0_9LACO|nr:peptide ABC transporter substrate-binding protein [Secundilactobacillus paracollinoides]ANZ61022.1 peptide ABC transporter substrate-binding protein [Secundilactobacillus paracollinoides]ANZ64555.1 peptide ABC transporter substrate-binding protein [Secundilactobacillus paracollinoides]ANZ66944.1 peptide ABC transporter substrate-binding protein [Secundilactobacillus paracollinoides]KRL76996.1 oligopeptide ABC superfamily ATP binding cassette transporter, binding protein [Secundilactobacillus
MSLRQKWAALAGVAGLALVLGACSSNSSSSKKTFTMPTDSELSTIDLSKSTALGTFDTLNNTNEGLYRLGKNSKPETGLATKMTQSKDGKRYIIDMRHNTKWSNGDTVTAQDFVYSWKRTVNPKTASQYSYLFSGIKNADAIADGKKSANTLGIKALGKYKLQIDLEQQIPYFKLLLGFPVFYPQNEKVVNKYGSAYGTRSDKMVYNGPYKLTKWNGTSTTWTLKKNNDYWDKKAVKMSSIKYQVVKDNQTALNQYNSKKLIGAPLTGNQAKNLKNNKDLISRPQSSSYYLAMNQKMKLFKNLKIREAISMAINRKQITNKVLGDGSFVNGSFVSKGLATNPKTGKDFTSDITTPESMTYNPTKAKQLWKEGLKETGITNPHFTILSADSDAGKKVTEYLQSGLEETLPGLKVSVSNIPQRSELAKQANHDYEVTFANWFADFADPITFLNIMTKNNPSNISGWSNSEYDSLINASSTTDANNASKRWDDMVKAQNIMMKDQGITPLYQSAAPWLLSSSVKDMVYNSAGASYNFKTTYLK